MIRTRFPMTAEQKANLEMAENIAAGRIAFSERPRVGPKEPKIIPERTNPDGF